ncbi:MAG TPA: tRNA epoxyqueuosine(34) reductase QueG [Planctomycetota bacterium]
MNLAEQIKTRARELGFEKAGIARVGPLPRAAFLREWLARAYQGDMNYMARDPERREDPSRYDPGAKSVVCVAQNYYTGPRPPAAPSEGVISRYAWGRDYHDVLGERLDRLREFIASRGHRARVCVDTSAVLEKLWARAAGLGWQGKHSNLIAKDLSSWFFIGEILVDAELEPDRPFERDHCGTCSRCIDVCPTRAIVAPYVLDARRCISYLTIEHRGPIARELRPLMGNLIFGCDLCLDVCPWNRFAQVTRDPAFEPRPDLSAPRLVEFLGMTDAEFRRRFKGSPILRAKRGGFLRNVCIALGNSGDLSVIPDLVEKGLGDSDPLVRMHAAWALGRLGAAEPLGSREAIETDTGVRQEIETALQDLRPMNSP